MYSYLKVYAFHEVGTDKKHHKKCLLCRTFTIGIQEMALSLNQIFSSANN
jgi:hypothetical protein